MSAKTIVVESEYVDRHYLEDYSEYYARCFPDHSKKCARLHFFSSKFELADFTEGVSGNDAEFLSKLSSTYLGNIVIRPIPHTCMAGVFLVPYSALLKSENGYKVITKQTYVSLFGVPLKIKTAAFVEQDKVVSACATSAVWALLNSTSEIATKYLPSPSAITKSASGLDIEGGRIFPTNGLSPIQIARSLRKYGLESTLLATTSTEVFVDEIKEHAFAFVSDDIPLLLGGGIYRITKDIGEKGLPETRYLGKHSICVLGYHEMGALPSGNQLRLASHGIDKLYAHDDRYGPYVRISMTPRQFLNKRDQGEDEYLVGLGICLDGNDRDYLVPDIAILAHYHKIRITYFQISAIVKSLHEYLLITNVRLQVIVKSAVDVRRAHLQNVVDATASFIGLQWRIALSTNSKFKLDTIKDNNFMSFNGAINKTTLLYESMPRYLWRCTGSSDDGRKIVDLLFDATEVPQGRILIGYVAYDKAAELIFKNFEGLVLEKKFDELPLSDETKLHLGSFTRFFDSLSKCTYLNSLYGPLRLPSRNLKPGESDQYENIALRKDVKIIKRGSNLDVGELDQSVKYIWVIDEAGDLVFGQDIAGDLDNKGHPTLVDGRPARIGGELVCENGTWFASLKSKAYSGHIVRNSEEADYYMGNVNKYNFNDAVRWSA